LFKGYYGYTVILAWKEDTGPVGKKPDVVCALKCWQGRTILLYKSTLIGHVIRLHLESAFVVEALKRNFHTPICVKRNERHGTLNAYYQIETGGQPYLMVAVKIQRSLGRLVRRAHFIKTFYGVNELPKGPFEWERKK